MWQLHNKGKKFIREHSSTRLTDENNCHRQFIEHNFACITNQNKLEPI